jgi:DNA uptake protein ComE-like DNA-binding protein
VRTLPRFMMLMLILADAPAAVFCCTSVPPDPPAQQADPPPEMRVDINHATIEELLKVPGLTRSWAGRILRFRPYHSKLDLLDLGVVSGEEYNRIENYIIARREKQ